MTRQLDYLVGRKMFGYSVYHYDKDVAQRCYYMLMGADFDPVENFYPVPERKTEAAAWEDCPYFSSDIAAAWQIVEKMRQKPPRPGGYMDDSYISVFIEYVDDYDCDCSIVETWQTIKGHNNRCLGESGLHNETMATVSLAISVAALRAVGVDEAEIQAALEVSA